MVPLGVNVDTKEPYSYDFTKSKFNMIVHDDIDKNIPFYYSLFSIIKNIPNTRIRAIDLINKFDKSKISIDCYTNNFIELIKALINEINKMDQTNNKCIYFINGITKLKQILETENGLFELFLNTINNSKNSQLIIADDYESYKTAQLDPKYRPILSSNRGIWLGEGINTQILIKMPNTNSDIINSNIADKAFIIDQDEVVLIKKVVQEKDDNNEK